MWEYYVLRGLSLPFGMKSYEYGNILSDYGSAYFNLGIDQYMDGRLEEASLAYSDMGIKLESAKEMAKRAIELYSDETKKLNAIDTLGWVYYKMGRYEDALNKLNFCKKALRDDPYFHYHMGMTLYMLDRPEEAQKELPLAADFVDAGLGRAISEKMETIRKGGNLKNGPM